MKKPTIKRVVGFRFTNKEANHVVFDTENIELVELLKEFGIVSPSGGNAWSMIIDSRYDFDDVLAYMESFNEVDNG